MAELKLERLVHEAEKPKRQGAANVDAAEHGPWRLSDPRLHAASRHDDMRQGSIKEA